MSFAIRTFLLPSGVVSTDLTFPFIGDSTAFPFGVLASKSSTILGRPDVISNPTTPPVWKVLIVNWVPGSPIDCADIIPTASPTSTGFPVAKLNP